MNCHSILQFIVIQQANWRRGRQRCRIGKCRYRDRLLPGDLMVVEQMAQEAFGDQRHQASDHACRYDVTLRHRRHHGFVVIKQIQDAVQDRPAELAAAASCGRVLALRLLGVALSSSLAIFAGLVGLALPVPEVWPCFHGPL